MLFRSVNILETYKKSNLKKLYKEIKSLPIHDYDLVLNDFEPVSAWACKLNKKICIGLSHQAAVINKKSPKPNKKDIVGKTILKNYALTTAALGFHFENYDHNIFTPIIRNQIRYGKVETLEHYTVYLPAYSDNKIIKILSQIPNIKWQVFSKHTKTNYLIGNITIRVIDNDAFIESMLSCEGILCGAGFETPAEALFLNKKLMVIPMKGQYEQQCNAAALEKLGVPVIKSLKQKHLNKIISFTENSQNIFVNYPDNTESVLNKVMEVYKILEKKTLLEKPKVKQNNNIIMEQKAYKEIAAEVLEK